MVTVNCFNMYHTLTVVSALYIVEFILSQQRVRAIQLPLFNISVMSAVFHTYLTFNILIISVVFLLFVYSSHIGDILVTILTQIAVEHVFDTQSDQTKVYIVCNCCFVAKYTALLIQCKDKFVRNQDNESIWRDMSTQGLVFM